MTTVHASKYLQIEGLDPSLANPLDFYPTPQLFCNAAMEMINKNYGEIREKPDHRFRILDAGSGTGNWGKAARNKWPSATIHGVDIANYGTPIGEVSPYDTWFQADYRDFTTDEKYDRIISNPPYTRTVDGRDMILAEKFVRKSFELLNRDGKILFLTRLDFLAGEKRCKGLFNEFRPTSIFQSICRIPFYPERGAGQTHNFCCIVWDKQIINDFPEDKSATFHWFDWRDGTLEII